MINLTEAKQKELINLAYDMRKNSYCPYSGFAVGAALLAEDGRIYTGGCRLLDWHFLFAVS